MISENELNELMEVPVEWRSGEEKILWLKSHNKYNIDWLETLWKYLCENFPNDLSIMENLNIIYINPSSSTTSAASAGQASSASSSSSSSSSLSRKTSMSKKEMSHLDGKNLILYKLSKNSNLVYAPNFYVEDTSSTNGTTNHQNESSPTNHTSNSASVTNINEETYSKLIKILTKLGFQCIDSLSSTILSHPMFQNYVPNLRKNRVNLLRALSNKYKHASSYKITQDFNALLSEADIIDLQHYLGTTT